MVVRRGSIVLVRYPFTDLSETKVRPAVVLTLVTTKPRDMTQAPICEMYYATTGVWNNEQNLKVIIDDTKKEFRNTRLFSAVNITPVDNDYLQRSYKEVQGKIEREIYLAESIDIPTIQNVKQAYIGILSASEYIKLISDEKW